MAANQNVAQLPVERKKLSQMMKLVAKSVELEEGDTLVLMDSGSALSVANIPTHVAHLHIVLCHLQGPSRAKPRQPHVGNN